MSSQTGDTDTSRLVVVRVPVETHKALRIRVAEQDTSIQQWVAALIERELGLSKEKAVRAKREG